MFRLSGDFIYTLATQLRPIEGLSEESASFQSYLVLDTAVKGLNDLFAWNALGLNASWSKGLALRELCEKILAEMRSNPEEFGSSLRHTQFGELKSAFNTFEITLKAELSVANLYAVTRKGAYDTNILAEHGLLAFPKALEERVPEAANDARQAARCLAFDLPTAAAFHLHRAHEAVVHSYFKNIAPDATPPVKQPLGAWIKELEKLSGTQDVVVAALKDINRLHRNPVLHPETSLADSEEAIALLGSICTTMRHMLQKIVPIAVEVAKMA